MGRDLAVLGRALSAPVRSTFLNLLMDGSTRPASELAAAAGVSAATASEHLGVLLEAGLLTCVPQGRRRFYRISDDAVASALEHLGQLCPPTPATGYRQVAAARRLAHARLCYDHLAGRLGVRLAGAMVTSGWVTTDLTALTADGIEQLRANGIDLDPDGAGRRPLLRPCPDWTERTPHLAGRVGAAIATHFSTQEWVVRRSGGRGLDVTSRGADALRDLWNLPFPAAGQQPADQSITPSASRPGTGTKPAVR